GDVFIYNLTHRLTYMGELRIDEFEVQVTVVDLPTIPNPVQNLSVVPSVDLSITFTNGSSIGAASAYTGFIEIVPLGTCEIMRPDEEISVEGNSIAYWVEDSQSFGFESGWSNIIAIMNTTFSYSKIDGTLLLLTSSWIDIASGLEMEYLRITRAGDPLPLVIAGGSICMIVVVIIFFERRKRSRI
ncbi:MAG: hypothetical protein ACFFED_02405, partial [Candidatus Thorarchaeota archaeon]